MSKQHYRTALVLSSGAMRGAYQCGVLKAFKEYDLQFDVVIGSSAGAYNGVRYLSNQMDICEEIYVTDLPGGQFINPRNLFIPGSHFLNLDYLVDEICRRKSRLIDMDEVTRSPSEFYITALEYDTMMTRFFDAKKHDIHLLLKATAAIPFLYSGVVMIDGVRYIDGGLLEPVPLSKALQLGCRKLCVVMNYPESDGKASYSRQLICKMPGRIPHLMAEHDRLKKEVKQFLHQSHDDLSLTVIRPRHSMSVGRFTSNGEKLQSCIDSGYRDGLELARSGQIVV